MPEDKPAISIRSYRRSEPFRNDNGDLAEKTTVVPHTCQAEIRYRISDTTGTQRSRAVATAFFTSWGGNPLAALEIPADGQLIIESC